MNVPFLSLHNVTAMHGDDIDMIADCEQSPPISRA